MDRTIFRDSTLTVGENAIETIFDREIALDFTSEEKAVRKETISSLLKNPKNSEKDIKILSLHFSEDNKNENLKNCAGAESFPDPDKKLPRQGNCAPPEQQRNVAQRGTGVYF